MSIATAAAEIQTSRRDAAWAEYRELLARADNPKPKDPERLVAALAVLGLTPNDFAADHYAINHMAKLAGQVRPDADVAAEVKLCDDDMAEMEAKFRVLLHKAIDCVEPRNFDAMLTMIVRSFATSMAVFQQFDEMGRGIGRLWSEASIRRDRVNEAQAAAARALEEYRLRYPRAVAARAK